MKRLIIALGIGLGMLAASCGQRAGSLGPGGGTGNPSPTPSRGPTTTASPTPTGSPTDTPTGSPSPTVGTVTYEVWFQYGEHLFVTRRTEPFTLAVGDASLSALLAGTSGAEGAAGVQTSVPAGTQLLALSIANGTATVDLSGVYESGGGSLSMSMRLAQVVYTITQFPSVQGVAFELDGQPVSVFGGEGIVLDQPATRQSFEDLLPAILVESPIVGQRVSSPVTISGTANVFEATVSIVILDADGNVIATTFTTATCGTGCRGDYSANVGYQVEHDQGGIIQVFESSAKDGSPINEVDIPVTLTA